jgi:F-box and WD-40 domain protein 1/11
MITTPKRKGKSKVVYDADGELLPLDGEEGELIDDEACFMETNDPDGIGNWANLLHVGDD